MKAKQISFIEFIALVAILMSLVSMTINMLLPAFHDISMDFNLESSNDVQLSISLLYLGLGVSQLFYGALSDSIGRKQTVYIGLILFCLGCLVSYLANSLNILLFGQLVQGLGLGSIRVMSVAIVRDQYNGNRMAKAMSFIMVVYILTPTISPILGKIVITLTNWRMLFLIYMFFGAFILLLFKNRMTETLPKEKQKRFTLVEVSKTLLEILKNRKSVGFTIILGLYSGVFITYLNLSQAIFEFQYNLKELYPYYFAFLALSIGLASFVNGKLVTSLGAERITKITIIISTLSSIPFLIINYYYILPFWIFVVFMFIQLFGYGLLIGNLNAMAMSPLGHAAGLGASIVGAISTIISVPLSIYIGGFYSDTALPIILAFLIVGTISVIIFNFIKVQNANETKNNKQLV